MKPVVGFPYVLPGVLLLWLGSGTGRSRWTGSRPSKDQEILAPLELSGNQLQLAHTRHKASSRTRE